MIKFDNFLFKSFLKHTGYVVIGIGVTALILFVIYVVYLAVINTSAYVYNNPMSTLKGIGYVLLIGCILNLMIAFFESIIKDANEKRIKMQTNQHECNYLNKNNEKE